MLCNLDYHIIDVCNVNCKHCNHFCPLVPVGTKPKSIEQITSDLTLASKIRSHMTKLTLLGGEPTLHPKLNEIINIARGIFPDLRIELTTNGSTYKSLDRWIDTIINNDIHIIVSVYPFDDNIDERVSTFKNLIPETNLDLLWYPTNDGMQGDFLSYRDDLHSAKDIRDCRMRGYCCQLKDGKIYLCNFAAQFNYLKDYFGDEINFDLDGTEYFDLNGDINGDDVEEFCYNAAPPICDHCLEPGRFKYFDVNYPWEKSNKELNEWYIQ